MAVRKPDPLQEILNGCRELTAAAPDLAVLAQKARDHPKDNRLAKQIRQSVSAIVALAAHIQEHGQQVLDSL